MQIYSIAAVLAGSACVGMTSAFSVGQRSVVQSNSIVRMSMSKGFGAAKEEEKPREKTPAQMEREKQSKKYDEISATGGQEYNIFVRQFGSDDGSWFPCGAIAVPRGAQVPDAIFANDEALKVAIVRTYPKLKGFEQEFEFGFNLKVYPDDPVEVATKAGTRPSGFSIGNWVNTLLSPIDASKVPPPPIKE